MQSIPHLARDPHFEPGEIVTITVLNPFENRRCHGKRRPAVLLEQTDRGWLIMGLTTNSHHADGTPRTPTVIPGSRDPRPSYLWGRPTPNIKGLDIHDHIGWIDEPTAAALAAMPDVHVTEAVLLGEDDDPAMVA